MKNETARREIESLDYYLQNHTDDYSEESHTAMMMAVKVLEQEPSGDLISREETLTAFADYVGSGMSMNDFDALWDIVAKLPPVNPTKVGYCKDCKWWKDSDGTYCRGVHAESKCPINRKEIYEGNGYCYMFEPQERSGEE